MKVDFSRRPEKRSWQKLFFEDITLPKIVTTGGPNINSGLKVFPSKKKFFVYETDVKLLHKYFEYFSKNPKAHLINGDIFNAKIEPDTFYSFDLCNTLSPEIGSRLQKFKDTKFSLTVALRGKGRGLTDTLLLFISSLNETLIDIEKKESYEILVTDKNRYKYVTYGQKEKTMPMLLICKI